MTEIDVIREWFKFAQNDLIVAKSCLALHPKQIDIACYHCQQSAVMKIETFEPNNLFWVFLVIMISIVWLFFYMKTAYLL
jgi:hypothetical protein